MPMLIMLSLCAPLLAAEKITYQDHIQPIFRNSCGNCHNADKAKGGLDLSTYSAAMAGSSGGEILTAGDADDSILYLAVTHQEEPTMPPKQDKLPQKELDLIKNWIIGGLLENSGSKAAVSNKPTITLAPAGNTNQKPDTPLPMPQHLLLEPVVMTDRPSALADIAVNPWAPIVALTGEKQILLYHSESLELLGILPYPNGFPHSLAFSRDGRLLLAGGGRAGQSGQAILWQLEDGKRILEVGDEYDAVLAADISSDLTSIALGGPSRLLKIYNTADGELLHNIKKHTDWIMAIAY
ncbi:MAG: hypothetical protein IID32_10040, partial [Planctomycetes bacterium]|nr:hypothetical protein [Planctomycetota bacterium]